MSFLDKCDSSPSGSWWQGKKGDSWMRIQKRAWSRGRPWYCTRARCYCLGWCKCHRSCLCICGKVLGCMFTSCFSFRIWPYLPVGEDAGKTILQFAMTGLAKCWKSVLIWVGSVTHCSSQPISAIWKEIGKHENHAWYLYKSNKGVPIGVH